MDIDIRSLERELLFRAVIAPGQTPAQATPPAGVAGEPVPLHWDGAFDNGVLRKCPVCRCHELFVRRDFPQSAGLAIVVGCAVAALVLFARGQVIAGMGVLFGAALVDGVILLFTGKCLVCYRCRSEFRGLPIPRDYPAWDLSTGEKYRLDLADDSTRQ